MWAFALEALEFVGGLFGLAIAERFLGGKAKKLIVYAGYQLFSLAPAVQINDLDEQLGKKTISNEQKAATFLLPAWHNAFIVGKYAPDKTRDNAWLHAVGQVVFPSAYTAYQLSKLKKKIDPAESSFAIWLAPSMYSLKTAKELNEDPKKLNILSQAIAKKELQTASAQSQPLYQPPIVSSGMTNLAQRPGYLQVPMSSAARPPLWR